MDRRFYEKTTLTQMQGLKVRSLRELANGLGSVPKGTVFEIMGKHNGLDLRSDPCGECGLRLHINRVSYRDVDIVLAMDMVDAEGAP